MVNALLIILFVLVLIWLTCIQLAKSEDSRQRKIDALIREHEANSKVFTKMLEEYIARPNRPVEVYLCPHCGFMAWIEKDCEHCGCPRPEKPTLIKTTWKDYAAQIERPKPQRWEDRIHRL